MIDQLPRSECTCIALRHDHEPRDCKRKGKIRGGICQECHYWSFNPERSKVDDAADEPI